MVKSKLSRPSLNLKAKLNIVYVLGILLIVASFLIGVLYTKVAYLEKNQETSVTSAEQSPEDAGQQPQVAVNIKDVDIKNEPYIGDDNAPVVMAYWLDF